MKFLHKLRGRDAYKKVEELKKLKEKYKAFPNYENELRKSFCTFIHKGDTVIDVGAHTGMHTSIFLNLVGDAGLVFAFEPLASQYLFLKEKFALNKNVVVVNKALSDKEGASNFFEVEGSPEESGFQKRKLYIDPSNARPKMIRVTVDKLDNYLPDFTRVDFIKMDTEGAEVDILKGSVGTLMKYRPIVSVEYGHPTYSLYGLTNESLFLFAKEHGYVLSDLWGNIYPTMTVWKDVCDSIYWDFFMVPKEKIKFFKQKIKTRENSELLFGQPISS